MNNLSSRYGIRLQSTEAYDLDAYPLSSPYDGQFLFFAYVRDEKLSRNEEFWRGMKKSFPDLLILARAFKGAQKSETVQTLFWDLKELPSEVWCKEGWIKFRLETNAVLNPGLFLDQKLNRQALFEKIQETIAQKTFSPSDSLLNLFSYTGSFSITAVAAGLKKTTSVDVSSRYLAWEKQSFEANFGGAEELGVEHRLIKEDARVFLRRALKRGDRYRWIVIDPPTFSKGQGKLFKVAEELPTLASEALECLDSGGAMLVSTNDLRWSKSDFEKEVRRAVSKLNRKLDFTPGKTSNDFSSAHSMKSLWIVANS